MSSRFISSNPACSLEIEAAPGSASVSELSTDAAEPLAESARQKAPGASQAWEEALTGGWRGGISETDPPLRTARP